MTDRHELTSLNEVLEVVSEAGEGERVSVSDIVEEIGPEAFAPLLLVHSIITVSPLSGIPGLSSVCGITIALISVQMVFLRRRLWLPGFLLRQSVERERLDHVRSWLAKPARLIDKVTRKRLSFLVRQPFAIVPAIICMLCGMTMPLLELVPFSSTILATAVTLFALSFVSEDGLLSITGTLVVLGAAYLIWSTVFA
jgi:hypothetical protein